MDPAVHVARRRFETIADVDVDPVRQHLPLAQRVAPVEGLAVGPLPLGFLRSGAAGGDLPPILALPATIGLGSAAQVSQATVVVRMKARAERARSQQQVLELLRRELAQIPGVRAFPRAPGLAPRQRSEPLQFVVRGPNLEETGRVAAGFQETLQSDPAIGRLDSDLQLDLPQLVLEPDRVRTAALGLTCRQSSLPV